MRYLLTALIIPITIFAFDFTQEYNTIPVYFDIVHCQAAWTPGWNYIQPTFCDLDGNGTQDLIMGSDFNRVTFLINTGDLSNHYYEFVTDYLVDFSYPPPSSQLTNSPCFIDYDNDNDYDLLIGTYNKLYFYENIGNAYNYTYVLVEDNFQGIELYNDKYPCFIDIDNDSDLDLFIGLGYQYTPTAGRLVFYENTGSPNIMYLTHVTEFFMNIDLGNYCIPSFIDIDADGDYDMFLGDEDGKIHYYRNDGTPEVYDFTFVTAEYAGVDVANIASPCFTDIDGDGDFDLFVGERSWGQDDRRGDVNFYENIGTEFDANFQLVTQNFVSMDIGLHSTPSFVDINNDGLTDMFLGDSDGNINYFTNQGSDNEPSFSLITEVFEEIAANYQSQPCFGDLDNDGDADLCVGRSSWTFDGVEFYINQGSPEIPDLVAVPSMTITIDNDWASPELIDIDGDYDLDLFIGTLDNQVIYYENIGTSLMPNFTMISEDYLNTGYINNIFASLCFGDIDGDGDYDILRGRPDDVSTSEPDASLDFYRNIGSPTDPEFILEEEHFAGINTVNFAEPFLIDIDNDGDLDLFVGDACGGVSFWRNNEVSGVLNDPVYSPVSFSLGQNYPNPFNSSTVIPFTLDQALPVKVAVYNQLGQEVAVLLNRQMTAGSWQINWQANNFSSGVYLITLETNVGIQQTRKVMLVK